MMKGVQVVRETMDEQRGSATVIVVGVLAVLTVMLMHITVASGILARESHVAATRTRLRYDAESAAEHACWMYLSDRKNHPSRGIQTSAVVELATLEEEERWRLDGVVHKVEVPGGDVEVKLLDADSGIDVGGADPAGNFRSLFDLEEEDPNLETPDIVNIVTDQIADYVDGGNDFRHLNGMERDDYELDGWPDLPRDMPFQFREEMLWIEAIPEAADVLGIAGPRALLETMRIIPPRGVAFPSRQKPNFFAAPATLIGAKLRLFEEEIDEVLDARRRWQSGDPAALEELPNETNSLIRANFSFNESGIVTIVATAQLPNGEIARTIRITRDCRKPPSANRDVSVWENWQAILDPTPDG